MIRQYKTFSLPTGYSIGLDNNYLYCSVPKKYLKHTLMVKRYMDRGFTEYLNEYMIIPKGSKGEKEIRQTGRYGLPDFTACYFRWIPYVKKEKVSIINQPSILLKAYKQMLKQKGL